MLKNEKLDYPQIMFFPLEAKSVSDVSEVFSRSLPKYFSTKIESLSKFKILNVYFITSDQGADSRVFTPPASGNEKFVAEYIEKSNISSDFAIYGTFEASEKFKMDIFVYDVKRRRSFSVGAYFTDKSGLASILAKLSDDIIVKIDGKNEFVDLSDHATLLSETVSSYDALYDYFLCVDEMARRNPYKPLEKKVRDQALSSLKHDKNFAYIIDIISFICDDYLRFNMCDEAIDICECAIKISNSYKFFLTIGKIYLQKNELKNAFKALKECLELNPGLGEVAHNFGQLAMDVGSYEDAKFAFNVMIDCDYKVAYAYDSLGVIMANTSDIDEAVNCWHKALEFEPSKVSAYANLGRAHIELNEFKKAEEYLKKAAGISPSYFMTYLNFSALYKKLGDEAMSKEYMDKAVFYNPDLAFSDEIRQKLKEANALVDDNRDEEAIVLFDQILKIHDRCWQAYFFKGIACRKLKRNDLSEEMFQKACEINNKFPDSQNELGLLYLLKGKFDDAMLLFNSALELSPNNAGFICNIGLCYLEMGNFQEAGNYFSRAKYLNPGDEKVNECIDYMKKKSEELSKRAKDDANASDVKNSKGFIDKIKGIFKK
ncbi:MAG TPA: tetratricopeptide repeat protein [Candidatus Wallbacteria bacterium]|nr:tetratricopeptide repeat protein [Candidatus Wallbacteria bacterium]